MDQIPRALNTRVKEKAQAIETRGKNLLQAQLV